MEYDKILTDILEKKEFFVVGKNFGRYDALDKCLGKAKFTSDYVPRKTMVVKVLRSTRPHAIIKNIEIKQALSISGVETILTAQDVPKNQIGYVIPDQPLLNGVKVHYIGDPIALICADNPYTAQEALENINVNYKDLPIVLDVDSSLNDDTIKIHDDGNKAVETRIRKGDIEKGFDEAAEEVEETYWSPYQEHMYLEPETAYAIPDGKNKVTIIGCMQSPFLVREKVANILNWDLNQVRIIQALTGGAFGGKDDMGPLVCAKAALAAVKTGREAALVYDRDESVNCSPKRFPARIRYRSGVDEEGRLTAAEVEITLECGAYANRAPFWLWRQAAHAAGPYVVPNVYVDGRGVYTNKVFGGSFRGFGDLAVHFAVESQMDLLAAKLHMDPVDFRLKNILKPGSRTACDQLLDHSVGMEECLKSVAEASNWLEKRVPVVKGKNVIGYGIGCAYHGISTSRSTPDWSAASLILNQDGTFTYRTGICELGQGSPFGHIKIVAEILGAPLGDISVERPDTDSTPNAKPTHGSRGLMMGGTAVADAAITLRERMVKVASNMLTCEEVQVKLRDGFAFIIKNPEKKISFSELAEELYITGVNPGSYGFYSAPKRFFDPETGLGVNYSVYTFAASVVEVEVDTETGVVEVIKVWPAMDVGKAIDPLMIEGQIHGAVSQGIGIALTENFLTHKGAVETSNFKDYIIPSALDTPEIMDTIIVEEPYKHSVFGAKGVGEPAIISIVPAITNAISHATGIRFNTLPITSERLFKASRRVVK